LKCSLSKKCLETSRNTVELKSQVQKGRKSYLPIICTSDIVTSWLDFLSLEQEVRWKFMTVNSYIEG